MKMPPKDGCTSCLSIATNSSPFVPQPQSATSDPSVGDPHPQEQIPACCLALQHPQGQSLSTTPCHGWRGVLGASHQEKSSEASLGGCEAPWGCGNSQRLRGGGAEIKDKEEILAHWQGTYFSNIKANGGTLK